jgi:hypothetical protein
MGIPEHIDLKPLGLIIAPPGIPGWRDYHLKPKIKENQPWRESLA